MKHTHLYEKKVTCPLCRHHFTTTKVKQAGVKILKRDPDFCGYYQGDNPTFYGIYLCPKCGYAAFESEFKTVTDYEKTLILNQVSQHWKGRDFGGPRTLDEAIMVHQLCLHQYNLTQKKASTIAKLCMRLAWFYRMSDNEAKERHFVSHAFDQYRKAYDLEHLEADPELQIQVYYLMGELARQLEDYKTAVYWFQETLKCPLTKTKKKFNDQVRDQMLLAKEGYKMAKDDNT